MRGQGGVEITNKKMGETERVEEIEEGEIVAIDGVATAAVAVLPDWVEERLRSREEELSKNQYREPKENLDIPNTEVGAGLVIETVLDERDGIEPYKQDANKKTKSSWPIRYMRGTRWISADDVHKEIIFPDEEVIKEYIYASNGILSDVLKKMNWHGVSKVELARWISKYGLERDLAIARDGIIDKAENVVVKALDTEDVETAKFVLKTAGKKRGWNERTEDGMEQAKNVYQFINIAGGGGKGDFSKMGDRDLVKYLEEQITGAS